jgi:fibronectin-binding autotransporter adhesin
VVLANGASISTNVTLANQSIATFDGAGVISGPIAGEGQLIKEGNGKIELVGNNSYAGQTVIRSGVLQLGNGGSTGAISTSSAIVNDSALVIDRNNLVRQGVDFTNQAITGIGSLTAAGTGTTILTANNAYAGETHINTGADLRINGNHIGTGAVNVAADAKLGGSGSVMGNINVSGILSPGNSIESFGSDTVNFSLGSLYAYEIDTMLLAADLLYSYGYVNIEEGAILSLSDMATISTQVTGTKFTLISSIGSWNGGLFLYDAGSGLAPLADDSLIAFGANTWLINYNDIAPGMNYVDDTSGANYFMTITAVPEPSVSLLLSFVGLFFFLRRRWV